MTFGAQEHQGVHNPAVPHVTCVQHPKAVAIKGPMLAIPRNGSAGVRLTP